MKLLMVLVSINIFVQVSKSETGKLAGYNEFCDTEEGIYCQNNKTLTCTDSLCKCSLETSSNKKFVYINETKECLPIAQKWDGWGCKYTAQCKESKYGKYSRCLTGKYSKLGSCECHDVSNRPVQLVDGTCTVINLSELTISSSNNDWACNYNYQCTNSTLGIYSKCNTTTGSGSGVGKCECFDTEGFKRNLVKLVDNICYVEKKLGESCKNDNECNAVIAGESICLGSHNTGETFGVCQCALGYQFLADFNECLRLGTLGTICKSDFQCQHIEALGELSKCHESKKVCECWDVPGKGQKEVKFHGGSCHYSRRLNQTCNHKLECVLGYHENSDCLMHDSYNGARVCQCPDKFDCTSSTKRYLLTAPLIVLTAVLTFS